MAYEQSAQLLQAVWGTTVGNFRVFHDSIKNDPSLAQKISGDFATVAPQLEMYNQCGYGVYFIVNQGGNTDSEITTATAICIDIDNGSGLPAAWHLAPHIIMQKAGTQNYHAYWLLDPTNDIATWSYTCKRLIAQYNSDPRIFNPSRVMRLPEFMHLKDPSAPMHYDVIYFDTNTPRYTLAQVATGLPEVDYTHNAGKRGQVVLESDDQFALDRVMRFITRCEPAIEGQGGDTHTFAVAARCRDQGLSEEMTLQVMLEYFNPRCEPPWNPDELAVKVSNAYAHSSGAQGAKHPLGAFAAAGMFTDMLPRDTQLPSAPVTITQQPVLPNAPLPQDLPVPTPTTDTPVNVCGTNPYDVTMGVGYDKNHTENAGRFLMECYPAGTLRNYNETWYWYNGKCWQEADHQAMKRAVTTAMLNASPSTSEINGTLAVLESIVTTNQPLGYHPTRDPSSLILLQNGILDIDANEFIPHTREFFSTNILPYAYNPEAQCPTWDAFQRDIFEGDEERVQFVEEWLGYNMVRSYDHQKIAMFIGVQRSGKTTIANIAKRLVGTNNYYGIGLEGFASDGTLEGALDKTVLWVGDAGTISGPSRSTIVDRLKTISGAGDISVNRKWKTAFSGQIPGRISITCNNILQFNDDSGALAGRFIICPFNKSFYGKEDPTLERRLAAELPGIANRCIAALARLRKRGKFIEPAVAETERESITYRYSPILAFISDECTQGAMDKCHTEALYNRYKAWLLRSGGKALPRRIFVDAIRSAMRGKVMKGPVSINGIRLQGFEGLGLTADEPVEVGANQ